MDRAFVAKEITPTTLKEQIMYDAGSRAVVEWCRGQVRNAELVAADNPIVKPND